MGFCSRLFGASSSSAGSFSLLCSACYASTPAARSHVIPWWNESAGDFYTTYRCDACWLRSLEETLEVIRQLDEDRRARFVDFLRRHRRDAVADAAARGTLAEASAVLAAFVAEIRSGKVVLSP